MFYHCDLCALIVLNTYALWRRKDVVTQETFFNLPTVTFERQTLLVA